MTATRPMRGAISLSISSHFSPLAYSRSVDIARVVRQAHYKAAGTGSMTCANTIGIERVSSRSVDSAGVPLTRIASGFRLTSSAALALSRFY
jgi:hypothetical protein